MALPYVRGRVLDVGCCTGDIIPVLQAATGYVGVDINNRSLDLLKGKHPECEVYRVDVQKEAIPCVERFDTIMGLALIEHLEEPDRFLDIYVPLLEPGGSIVLTTPTPWGERIHQLLQSVGMTSSVIKGLHHSIFKPQELAGLMKSHGLEAVCSRTFEFGMNQLYVGKSRRLITG